jgi:hypothetical protein
LNYNSNGVFRLQLLQGPQIDSYFIYILVNIIDDSNGKTVFNLKTPIQVLPNNNIDVFDSIIYNNASNQQIIELYSGNLNLISKNVIFLSNTLNTQNLSSLSNDQKASMREYFMDKLSKLSISNMNSIKVMSSAISLLTSMPEQVSSNLGVLKISQIFSLLKKI